MVYLDVAVVANGPDGTSDSVVWMAGNGDGTFGAIQYIAPPSDGTGPGDVDLADFDGDGDLDAVVAFTGNGNVEIYDNDLDVSGNFNKYTQTVSATNDYLFDIAFADVDNDGDLDILKTDLGGAGDVSYIINNDALPNLATGFYRVSNIDWSFNRKTSHRRCCRF